MVGKEVRSQQLKGGAPASAVQITEHHLIWTGGAIRVLTTCKDLINPVLHCVLRVVSDQIKALLVCRAAKEHLVQVLGREGNQPSTPRHAGQDELRNVLTSWIGLGSGMPRLLPEIERSNDTSGPLSLVGSRERWEAQLV